MLFGAGLNSLCNRRVRRTFWRQQQQADVLLEDHTRRIRALEKQLRHAASDMKEIKSEQAVLKSDVKELKADVRTHTRDVKSMIGDLLQRFK